MTAPSRDSLLGGQPAGPWQALVSPAALALGPRWIDSCRAEDGSPLQRFALCPLRSPDAPGHSWRRELLQLAHMEPVAYRPVDEDTLGTRQVEGLWSFTETTLRGESELARLLHRTWCAATTPAPRPRIMGILNVTPDSFSDGGKYAEGTSALERALEMRDQGAHILDIGGESTRPGSDPVSVEEEWTRVGPVIESLAGSLGMPISIDTTKAEVARRALDSGADWVNDISAGTFDPGMLPMVAERSAPFIAMHCPDRPDQMQQSAHYGDVVSQVTGWLRLRLEACKSAGIAPENLCIDPGIGFGKRLDHNLSLLRRLWELKSLGCPLLLGVSRKSFIDHLANAEENRTPGPVGALPTDRLGGTAAALFACIAGGASILRVHDVSAMVQAAQVAHAIQNPTPHAT
ncbi:MAG: dihydropteroate synthase [Planctomycetota bacterium]|nr:dihydropteroate synthase [Planctomycetota bacterium]